MRQAAFLHDCIRKTATRDADRCKAAADAADKKRKHDGRAEEEIEDFSIIERSLYGPDWKTLYMNVMTKAASDYRTLKSTNEGMLRALVRRVEERVDSSSVMIPLSDWLIYAYHVCMRQYGGVLSPEAKSEFITDATHLCALLMNPSRSPKIVQIMAKRWFFPVAKTAVAIAERKAADAYNEGWQRTKEAAKRLNKK